MSLNKREFLTQYILSLKERTRNEKKKGTINYGFDWIIYQLQSQKAVSPVRLPFFRSKKIEDFQTKPYEAEFGIDLSFITKDKKTLIIFILKDEKLTYANWTKAKFDIDLRRATQPDIKSLNVKNVRIILAYNKDEDRDGIKCFENFKDSCNAKIHNNVTLSIERWNLTKIVEEVESSLLTSEFLPQNLSGILSYICSQISEFEYMSNEWQNQLIPNWNRFLETVFKDTVDEARINLVAVALIIIYDNKRESNDKEVAWIDLIEWAVLHLWSKYRKLKSKALKTSITKFWIILYLGELEKYYNLNKELFKVEHGIKTVKSSVRHLSALNDSMLCYDFISKFGLMTLGLHQYIPEDKWPSFMKEKSNELNNFIHLNPSIFRPLLDINHIQLYMVWLIFYLTRSDSNIIDFFMQLENYLMVRRIEGVDIPFIEGRNNLDLVVEYMVSRKKPYEFVENSSYLLMMVIEQSVGLNTKNGKKLTELYFKHLVLGYGDDDKLLTKEDSPIDLQSWNPPENWDEKIFLESITTGVSISSSNFFINKDNLSDLDNKLKDFLRKSAERFPNTIRLDDIPLAVYLLACIKNKSPLPPIFWRHFLFNDLYKKMDTDMNNAKEKIKNVKKKKDDNKQNIK